MPVGRESAGRRRRAGAAPGLERRLRAERAPSQEHPLSRIPTAAQLQLDPIRRRRTETPKCSARAFDSCDRCRRWIAPTVGIGTSESAGSRRAVTSTPVVPAREARKTPPGEPTRHRAGVRVAQAAERADVVRGLVEHREGFGHRSAATTSGSAPRRARTCAGCASSRLRHGTAFSGRPLPAVRRGDEIGRLRRGARPARLSMAVVVQIRCVPTEKLVRAARPSPISSEIAASTAREVRCGVGPGGMRCVSLAAVVGRRVEDVREWTSRDRPIADYRVVDPRRGLRTPETPVRRSRRASRRRALRSVKAGAQNRGIVGNWGGCRGG